MLQQNVDDYEIILVDDGSTDGSSALCDKIAADNNIIKVIHKENGGLSDARNAGINEAVGKYLLFVDGDDYIEHMEAMAVGLPCVVFKIRGNVDLINGERGFLCEIDNSKEYYTAIYTLMDDIVRRKLMSTECKDKIAEYDIKVVCSEIKNIYSQILAKGEI